ncbi:MAG: response regulator, partial [Bacteroidia bacterium]|nr:response regulator [Bacteroidia bacterium]
LLKKRSAKAIVTLEDVLLYNQGNQNSGINHQVFELLADAYAQQRNYSSAYTNLHKAKQIKDSLNQFQGAARIKEIEGKYQTESRDREIALLTSQNELAEQQKTNQRNLLLGGLGITGLLGLFFFVQYRNRQKTNLKLKELDLAKSTFFANISHEFRTPLTLIKGPIDDQLASGNLNKSERFNLQTASSNANRLESLVDQLLALSKLESGNLNLQVQPGNLPQFIAAQLESFHFRCKEKDIEMVSRVTEDEQLDWFDRDALQKVVFNLIGNAVKYTPTQGTIEISGKRNDGSYEFSVLNSGTTLSQEQRSRIFERFYQTSDQNTGTGIGLALTKELVELHKGKIHLPDTAKGFTMFQVEIPTHRGAFEDSELLSEELQQWDHYPKGKDEVFDAPTEIAAEDAPVLLIVDDNSEIRTYVKSLFDGIYKVHEAADGADGFEQAIELIPDIVISDVMMPVEDGYSLTRRIKENELTSHIPVILLTAKTDDLDKLQGTETGADSYVTKPFNSELLKAKAQNLLDIRRKLQQRFAQEVILKPREVTMTSADERFIERLQLVFDEQLTNPDFTVDKLSREMGVSRMQLHRKLKALTGRSSSEFIRSHRLKLAIQLLKENNATVAEIGYSVGFNDPSYFTKCFKQEYGCSPTEYSPVSN